MLAGLRVRDSAQDALVFTRIEQLATLSDRMGTLVQELEDERDLTTEYLARPSRQRLATLREQQGGTDRAVSTVRGLLGDIDDTYSSSVRTKVDQIRYRLDSSLPTMRGLSSRTNASAATAFDIYSQTIATFLEFGDLIAQGSPDTELAEGTRALAALGRAKDAASQERALVTVTLMAGGFTTPADRERLLGIRSLQDSQYAVFRSSAALSQRQLYDDTVTGPEIGEVESLYQQVLISSGASPTLSVRPLSVAQVRAWNQASSARIEQIRKVEGRLVATVIADSRALKNDARQGALTDGGLLLVGLLLVLALTVLVARSLVRPLRRLRTGALEVADVRLPGLVERLRETDEAPAGIDVDPIDIHSTDEIGEVARAFDEVHREAVRLAAEEAVLRGNINAMFVNLSRRSQSLIERQLRLIDELEQSEQDEERLASLFRLDHLATRMRRNCENLLVLGGQEQVRRWNQAVPLIDIVRASLSEVEQYERVGLRIQGEVSVIGPVVNDLVHLVAELVENATVFSADHTRVTVSGHLLSGGGAMLQITDNGVGMSPEELEEANWRLANPPTVDFSAARRMGLFVVGRLASRHTIRVELRAALSGGLTAFVLLPPQSVAQGSEPTGSAPQRFGAEQQAPAGVGAAAAPRALGAAMSAPTVPAPREPGPPADDRYAGHRDAAGTGGYPAFGRSGPGEDPYADRRDPAGTGAHPVFGQTGPQPVVGDDPYADRRDPAGTGAHPVFGQTGPQPVVGDDPYADRRNPAGTGAHPVFGQTGPQPVVGDDPYIDRRDPLASGGHPVFGQTSPQPIVNEGSYSDQSGPYPTTGRPPGAQPGNQALPQRPPGASGMRPGGARPGTGVTGPQPSVSGAGGGALPGFTDAQSSSTVSWSGGEEPPARPPERSPIFDAMESEWFQRRNPGVQEGKKGTEQAPPVWQSRADEGWKVAEAARKPAAGGRTSTGLPKRVPGRNRVPGSVPSQARPPAQQQRPAAPAPAPQEQPPTQAADFARNRFASLQRGAHRGRAEARNAGPEDTLDPPSRGGNEQGGGS
ncbi:hypothetical protein DPM19_29155 [Actinomadura craniellae]|uniref:histidine kinase n=2 Tax=Actinomadura craniellae TaxID=2231787 RepID=A0A365GY78_9ACTN|nr:hypothetical protein DPM19_29155 [Actinomadura craniellae]